MIKHKVGDVVMLKNPQGSWHDERYVNALEVVKWRGTSANNTISLSVVNHNPDRFFYIEIKRV